jgi:hypothetical protein
MPTVPPITQLFPNPTYMADEPQYPDVAAAQGTLIPGC